MNYTTWRPQVAAALKRPHGIDADRIPERVWREFTCRTPRRVRLRTALSGIGRT